MQSEIASSNEVNKTNFDKIVLATGRLMISMQPRKSTKMIAPKPIEETRVSPETVVAAGTKKTAAAPRKRTTKPKEMESAANATPRAAKHRAAKPAVIAASTEVAAIPAVVAAAPARAMAAAAGAGSSAVSSTISIAPPTEESIAVLAYSYWLDRGCGDGSAEEDWLRAENELRSGSN